MQLTSYWRGRHIVQQVLTYISFFDQPGHVLYILYSRFRAVAIVRPRAVCVLHSGPVAALRTETVCKAYTAQDKR